jgi:hypothetical protein
MTEINSCSDFWLIIPQENSKFGYILAYFESIFFLWRYSPNLGLVLPPWNSPFHFRLLDLRHSVGLLGWVISSSQGLYLYTNTEKRARKHTHTHTQTLNIDALSGIQTHDPGSRESEDSTVTGLSPINTSKFKRTTKYAYSSRRLQLFGLSVQSSGCTYWCTGYTASLSISCLDRSYGGHLVSQSIR